MICKECLIWRNRNESLQDELYNLVPSCIKIGMTKKDIPLISEQTKVIDMEWRHHISLIDTNCPEGRCIV